MRFRSDVGMDDLDELELMAANAACFADDLDDGADQDSIELWQHLFHYTSQEAATRL